MPTATTVAVAAVVLLALAVWLHGRRHTAIDDWAERRIVSGIGPSAAQVLIDCSAPLISVVALAVVVLGAGLVRRWDLAVLAVLAPAGATLLTEFVGKPLVGRPLGSGVSFPSGHETAVGATAWVLVLAAALLPVGPRLRLGCRAGLLLWVVAGGVGLVRGHYHYLTDVAGALAWSTVAVLGGALLVDGVSSGRRAGPSATSVDLPVPT